MEYIITYNNIRNLKAENVSEDKTLIRNFAYLYTMQVKYFYRR